MKLRCKSAAPGTGWRCEKAAKHVLKKKTEWHSAGFATWGKDEGSIYVERPFATPIDLTITGNPHWHDLVKPMGSGLLAGLRANFEAMDEAERATDPRRVELADWWRQTAEAEIKQTVDKAVEYGATDLIDIGRTLARVAGRELGDAEAAEWGIFFYLEGKLSRWRSAIERGDLPSFDTLLDIGVYARMAQRVRQNGGWPGTDESTYKQNTYGEEPQ